MGPSYVITLSAPFLLVLSACYVYAYRAYVESRLFFFCCGSRGDSAWRRKIFQNKTKSFCFAPHPPCHRQHRRWFVCASTRNRLWDRHVPSAVRAFLAEIHNILTALFVEGHVKILLPFIRCSYIHHDSLNMQDMN